MEKKIKAFFKEQKIDKVKSIKQFDDWAHGHRYHVRCWNIFKEFTVYELNGKINSVRDRMRNETIYERV